MSSLDTTWNVVSSSPTFGRYSHEPIRVLEDGRCAVQLVERNDEATLSEALLSANAWIAGFEPVGEPTLEQADGIRVVAKCGAGLDNFDLDYLSDRGIAVVSVPGGNSTAVAEYAVTQMLALARGLVANDVAVRSDAWKPNVGMGLGGRTLGIVGYGAIGQELARLATAFGMRVVVTDPQIEASTGSPDGIEILELGGLLDEADFVSLHVPLTDGTHHLFGEREFARMKSQSFLVNDSRGGVVDEVALREALVSGAIAGAAVDVFEQEPLATDNPLLEAPNLLVSPHTAGYSDSALATVTLSCATSVLAALQA